MGGVFGGPSEAVDVLEEGARRCGNQRRIAEVMQLGLVRLTWRPSCRSANGSWPRGRGVSFVLDASSMLAFVQDEAGAEIVEGALDDEAVCSAANWSEVAQRVLRLTAIGIWSEHC